ncbi:MAG: type I pullulanase [Treponema sp.]|jgi:pullulanase|nr:type I pullulanase [Treponema sp.]
MKGPGRFFCRVFFAAVLGLFFSCSPAGPRREAPEVPAGLRVHYYRYMGDYAGWNLWIWPADPPGEGRSFPFGPPGKDGWVTAHGDLPGTGREFGVIIRKSGPGNEWAEKEGNADRFTREQEVWIRQNDPAVYTEKPGHTGLPLLFAAADRDDLVNLSLSGEPADYGTFAVYDGDTRLAGKSAGGKNAGDVVISLEEKISDPSKQYMARDESGVFGDKPLTMRNILDGYYYGGDDLGLSYGAAASGFKVWAPTAVSVSLALYDEPGTVAAPDKTPDNGAGRFYPMERDQKTGVWALTVAGDLAGKYYLFRAAFADGTVHFAADPYARAVSANGRRMAVVNLADTNPPGWGRKLPPQKRQDAVLYELHIRDFSIDENSGMKHKGKYLAFTEGGTKNAEGFPTGVDHLKYLGISHVHLLPAFDFASINELTVDDPQSAEPKFNWGYDPQNYNVPEGSYATDPQNPRTRIIEFKQMVQALHNAGIRVVMDVVYNHTFRTGAGPFDSIVPGYYYRTAGNGVLSNGSACGNEVASERPMVRKFIIDSCKYWVREYQVDGFRFDLMGLIDTPTMEELNAELRALDPGILIYGEPWQAGGSVLDEKLQTLIGAQKNRGFAVFNDRFRWAIKGGSDDPSRGFATGQPGTEAGIVKGLQGSVHDFTAAAGESVNYVTAHDNLNLWDKIAASLGADPAAGPYAPLDKDRDLFEHDAVKSVLLANGIILTSQGIPFFQAGDEFLRSKFGDFNSYASPDSINKIRWENAGKFRRVSDYYAGLIRLRREHPAFRMDSKSDIEEKITIISAADNVVAFSIGPHAGGDSWETIFVAYNGSGLPKTLELPKTAPRWYQTISPQKAGVETLAEITGGRISLSPLTMTVLHN